MRIELNIPYPPTTGNHATKRGQGRTYTDASIVAWRGVVANLVADAGAAQMLPGPLHLTVWAAPPDARGRDSDNLIKVLGDALTRARVWVDDSNKVIPKLTVEWFAPVKGGALKIIIETA